MKPPTSVLSLDQQVCFPLYAASNLIQRLYRPLLAPLGLTYAQYLVMLVLWEQEGIPVRELERRVLLDSGTLSPLLRRLEQAALLTKRPSTEDGRVTVLALTSKGRRLRAQAQGVPEALVCRMLAGRKPAPEASAQLALMRTQLKALVTGLEHAIQVPTPARKKRSA